MVEEKIARICWNNNFWQKPSGPEGKSRNKKAYEYLTGYGHEEWLLDTEKTIDGYHYSYLQAIGAHRDRYIGKKFHISLYSIKSDTKERWWIGEIKNVELCEMPLGYLRYIYKNQIIYTEQLLKTHLIIFSFDYLLLNCCIKFWHPKLGYF